MDCLIQIATALCLIQPSGLTLRADISTQVGGSFSYWADGRNYHGGHVGRIEINVPLATYRNFTLLGGIEHLSLVDTDGDRGQERISLGLVWRPFGGVR